MLGAVWVEAFAGDDPGKKCGLLAIRTVEFGTTDNDLTSSERRIGDDLSFTGDATGERVVRHHLDARCPNDFREPRRIVDDGAP